MTHTPTEGWHSGMDHLDHGPALLDEVEAFLRRFVVFPADAAATATALWAAHTHMMDAFDSTPRLAFLSPEPGSGKTRALEILETLVPNPMLAVNATPAALFRAIADTERKPTVLFDEIDTVFGPKAKDNEELRGLINAGHRRSGVSYRCVGDGSSQTVAAFPSYAAIGLGGLGELPDTVLTRSVIVRMRRRAPHERVEPYRARLNEPQGHALRERLTAWASAVADSVRERFPAMPEGVSDRPADVWEPLLMVADAAGGPWPGKARSACVELVAASADPRRVSLGVRLLADTRAVFRHQGADKLPTQALLGALADLEDAPWAELGGKGLDSRGLSRLLKDYTTAHGEAIKSRTVRMPDGSTPKGYHAADLADAWSRYLPPPDDNPAPAESPPMASQGAGSEGVPVADRSATPALSATQNTPLTWGVSAVADVADLPEAGPVAVESGACWSCGDRFRRFEASDYPDMCTPCATSLRTTA
ncbi:DUF3631 domain-containing protein [Nocardiopsis sp. CNT312]|uniref:DUF3631 domain-containing protein n=1 Tax=Nocardiopsis sp. CNT312 TaxID=1137268 RepID=UPI0004B4EAC8|nr:DUF3631 domain-containing protein [Nocardiopsis sp. CNT312]